MHTWFRTFGVSSHDNFIGFGAICEIIKVEEGSVIVQFFARRSRLQIWLRLNTIFNSLLSNSIPDADTEPCLVSDAAGRS